MKPSKMPTKKPFSRPEVEEVKVDDQVHFDAWWSTLAKERKFPAHLKEVIWADFRSRGIKMTDSKINFEAALTQFGY